MAKRVFASVRPEILEWARLSAGVSLAAAARTLKLEESTISGWELGVESPSIPQLRGLAGLYKRPLAVFYLQQVPRNFQVLSDLRRARPGEDHAFSPALTYDIRAAQQRRRLAQELAEDLDDEVEPFAFRLGDTSAEDGGDAVRKFLGVSEDAIRKFGSDATGRDAFNLWRKAIEDAGVLVFQSSKIPQSEASGFALAYDELPVVVVNRKDAPQRRLFSLLHEFAHIALRQSGVSDLKLAPDEPREDAEIEMRCNAIAASALMPHALVQSEFDQALAAQGELNDSAIAQIARRFGVSRPALLLRLVRMRRTTWDVYFEKDAQYKAEYERSIQNRPPAPPMKRNIPQESLSDLGRPFIGLVFGNYHQRKITLSDVAGYLGVRVKHIEALERKLAS